MEESSTSLKVIRTAREEQPWIGAYREDGGYTEMCIRDSPLAVAASFSLRA